MKWEYRIQTDQEGEHFHSLHCLGKCGVEVEVEVGGMKVEEKGFEARVVDTMDYDIQQVTCEHTLELLP